MADKKDEENATPEEKQPINNVQERGEADHDHAETNTEVHPAIRQPRAPGCFVTRTQACLTFIVVLFLLVVVGMVVGLLVRPRCACLPGGDPRADEWLPGSSAPKPTVDPALPWAGIRLPETIRPSFYTLELRVNLATFEFNGAVDIDVEAVEDTEYVIVHSHGLSVSRDHVWVQDADTQKRLAVDEHIPVPVNQFYVMRMDTWLRKGQRYKIHFGYFKAKMTEDLRGLYLSSYKDSEGHLRYLAASQLQSVDARSVFPCFDEPDLKANFSVTLIHKKEYTALCNMPVQETSELKDGWVKDRFQPTPLMSTYLLAFVVADFKHREKVTDNNLTIRIWARPDMEDQTVYPLEFAARAYVFFAGYFGTPEIVPKADHAAIPDFSAGAMENWGLVLYRETALLHDEQASSISNKYWVSLIMAHEIAHTWFGNMVTMRWWDDLWLNEGFANTLMYFALDSIYPSWKVFDLQLVNNVYPVMTKDSLLTSHAISTPIKDPDDIPQFFDSISYDKGMAVLRLLRGFLGWDDFQKGLQMYIQKYKYSNAEMSELWTTFAEAVNHRYNVGEIMDTWTRQMGFPVVTVRRVGKGRYRLEQERFLLNSEDKYDPNKSRYKYKWRIPFIYKVQGETKTKTQWMELKHAEIRLDDDRWVLGNVDYMGFFRTNYDQDMWRRLIAQLNTDHTVFSAANRAGLISDAFNLARANKLSYETALNLTSYLHKENDYVPWRAFLDSIDFLKGMLSTSNAYGVLQRYISKLVAEKYRKVGTSDQGDLLERNLRRSLAEAATSVGVPDAVSSAKKDFDLWMQYGTKILPDYAMMIYSVGIQQGGEMEWNHLWNKSQDTRIASESEIMMNALAYTQEPWLLWRYARWSLDSTKIRMQDVRNLFGFFASTPLGRSVALQFLLTNWQEINKRFGMDAFLLRDIIYATTSLISTEFEYKQLKLLYRESPPAGVARKAAENSLALVRSNINWMKLHHDTIHKWLTKNTKEN